METDCTHAMKCLLVSLLLHNSTECLTVVLHIIQCPPLTYVCFTDNAENLPAVMAGVVVAFLLLTLLIAGIIVGVVMLRRAKRRKNSPKKKGKLVEKIECAEKQEESPESEPTAGNNNEWQTDEAAFHDEQHVEGLYYESTDVLGQGPLGREEGNRIRFEGGQYDDIVAALPKWLTRARKRG